MWRPAFNSSRFKKDNGAYLAIVAASAFVILSIAGLAVDTARIYWTRSELQRAVDAAALSTARLMARDGSLNYSGAPGAIELARDLLAENFSLSRMSADEISRIQTTICFNDPNLLDGCALSHLPGSTLDRRYVYAEASLDRATLILGWIPGFAKSTHVAVKALAENLQFQVVLVLDSSGSMNDAYGPQRKIDYLHSGAKQFIETLLPFDKVGIVKFSYFGGKNTAAMTSAPPIVPVDMTPNWEDHIESDYKDDAVRVYPVSGLMPVLGPPGGPTETDLKNGIDSIQPDSNTNIGSGIRLGREIFSAEGPAPVNTLRLLVVVTDGAPTAYYPVSWPNSPTTSLSPGLHNLNHPNSCNLPELLTTSPSPNQDQLRQLDAIWESDKARKEEDAMVVTLGLGVEDTNYTSPFQNIGNGSLLKRILLERVANYQDAMLRTVPAPSWTTPVAPVPPYIWDFPCVDTGESMRQYKKGLYLFADNGPELVRKFKSLGELRTRLAQ